MNHHAEAEYRSGDGVIYSEDISSARTEALFVALTILFFLLFIWRLSAAGMEILAAALLLLSGFFLFYSVNYRTLKIRLTSKSLELAFGVFTWSVPLDNVEACDLDHLPKLMEMGGAGIHYMSIRRRYRVSFNFLEYPRVVVALRRRAGLVRDVSFSTRRPDEILRLMQAAAPATGTA